MEVEDEAKLARPGFNKWATNWLKTPVEKIYNTTLSTTAASSPNVFLPVSFT